MPDQTLRDRYERRRQTLEQERESFIYHWKDLSQYLQPRRGRFETSDRNKGTKRHQFIINSKGTQALRVARAGMMAGAMSPTRPWFDFEPPDPDMMEFQPVKVWIRKVVSLIQAILTSSNFYNMTPGMLSDLLLFGTGCMSHVDDFQDVARFYTHPAGSYMVSQDDRYVINTIVREYEMTVEQLVSKFGLRNVSTNVRQLYDKGEYDHWYPVVHFVEPNPEFDPTRAQARFKLFSSAYYEPGNVDKDQFLQRSGFDEFPAYVPRWEVTGEDVYGTDCPGMTALGDVRALQVQERRKAQGIDKQVNPPLHGPTSLRNVPVANLPGGLTVYDDGGDAGRGLRPIYQVQPQLRDMMLDLQARERRIEQAFFNDLFLAITTQEGIQPKNELELMHRNQERLLQIGPVMEHLQGSFQRLVVERVFNQAVRANILPSAPPELQGQELEIKFISTLALAQRAAATGSVERLFTFGAQFAGVWPELRDKLDPDQAIDEYAHAVGAPPRVVVPDDVVANVRAARQQQIEQAQALEQAQMAGNTAKMLSDAGRE